LQYRWEQFILNYKLTGLHKTISGTSPDKIEFIQTTFSLFQTGETVPSSISKPHYQRHSMPLESTYSVGRRYAPLPEKM
jgi:hypothetical protein